MKLYKALLLFSFLFIQLGIFAQTTITIGISNGGSSICAGANITFYSQITNCAAPTYQWFINSIPVSGATNFTFTTNTLQNGDIVSARQTNATAPCTIANSNTIAITVTTQPVLTLSSGVGSNNQTVCQNVPLNNITYNVTGSVGSFSSSGFPTGISAILNNGVVTISGSTSQTGTFNYTVTASTTFCGNASATGTIIVSKRITPVLIPFLGSSTQLSIFNGIEYLIRCTSTPPSSINIANDIPAGDQLLVTNYKIEWGDGTPDTTFNPFSTNIVHLYQAGFYQLIITTTSTSGCTASKTYGVFVGNSPSGSLANPGNLSGCVPKTIDFPISATAGNIPGTIYKIYFGDGDSATYIHPNVPAVVPHTYLITSCGKNLGGPNPNSFTATMTVTNPCYPISTSQINSIQINEPPVAKITIIPPTICNNKTVNIINTSTKGNVVSPTGCKSTNKIYWEITAAIGWNTLNNFGNNGGNPNDIDVWNTGDSSLFVNFTQVGTYFVKLYIGNGCSGISTRTDTLIVNPIPDTPSVISPVVYCQNYLADTLIAFPAIGNTLKWYTTANGGIGNNNSPIPSTLIAGTQNFYVSQVTQFNCEGTRKLIIVNINPTPLKPSVVTNISYCQNATAIPLVATASGSNTIKWYSDSTGGVGSTTAPTPITTTLGTFYYYASQTNSFNCESPRASIKVTIHPNPTAPTVTSPINKCEGYPSDTLSAIPNSGNSLLWYTNSTGGVGNVNAPTPSTTTVGTTSFFVSQMNSNNCEGPRAQINVIVNSTPPPPSVISPIEYCQGAATNQLTATALNNHTLYWYSLSSGGIGNTTPPTPSSITIGNTYFYVSQKNSFNCESKRDSINVIINVTPLSPTVTSPVFLCQNDASSPLTATANTNNSLLWYNSISGGVGSTTAPTPSTTTIGNIDYFASQITPKNCESTRSKITVTVTTRPSITSFTFIHPSLCSANNGSITLVGLNNNTSYQLDYKKNGSPISITISSNSSGEVIINNLFSGTYSDITLTINSCISNSVGPIVLSDPNPPNTPTITAPTNICSGNNLNISASTTTTGTATYSWTGPNGFASSTQNPSINNIATAYSGVYSVTVTINNCTSLAATKNITVDSTPQKPTILTNSPICTDSTLNLSASTIYPGSMTYNWTGVNAFTSSLQNPNITNVTTIHAGNYSVTATSAANCISQSQTTTVVINPTPVISNTTFTHPTLCANADGSIALYGLTPTVSYSVQYLKNGTPQSISLVANSSGVATITNLLAGTYSNIYVVLNGCKSNVVGPIILSDPNPPNTPTITAPSNICSGNNLNLASSTTSSGTASYNWTGPNGFVSPLQNPSINNILTAFSGVYSVTVTINNCTSLAATKNITVDSTPQKPTILTNSPICTDSTLNLSASTISPGSMTYNWTGVNGFTSSLQNPSITNVTTIHAGNYSVTATSAANCISQSQSTTVVINPTPVISNTTFTQPTLCANADGSIALYGLTPTVSYSVQYLKNGTLQSVNLVANSSGVATIINLLAGTYSNIYVVLNGCRSNVVGPIVLSDPNPPNTPTITAPSNICSGNNLNISASTTTTGTATYNWTGPNGFVSSLQNPSINNIAAAYSGVYNVSVTINNCTSLTATKNITVDSTSQKPIIVTNSPICTDSTLFLSASTVSPGSMTYNWTGVNGFTSSSQNPSITNVAAIHAGNYSVTATSAANCISQSETTTVVVNPTPVIFQRNDTTYNDGVSSGTIKFTSNFANTNYTWTNSNTLIGLASSGIDSINFTTANPNANIITGIIRVTPYLNSCPGLPMNFNISINPSPKLSSSLIDSVCTNNVFNYQATSATNNVKFTWIRNVVSGIANPTNSSIDSSGLINETLINTTTAPINVVYQYKLHSYGNIYSQNVVVKVFPKAKAKYTFVKDTFCVPLFIDSSDIKLVKYDSANSRYDWYVNNNFIGSGFYFPGYSFITTSDSIIIKLKAISKHGCANDSIQYKFYSNIKPTVSFAKSKSQGCGPLLVNFTNNSTPITYSKYYWNFGNGTTSTLTNPPTISFNADNSNLRRDTTYYIKLYAITNCDSIMYVDSVKVLPKPKALFQPDTTVGCSVFHFRAFNNSLGSGNTYYWDFGDGTTVYDTAGGFIYHNYYTPVTDTFTLKLVANNTCGTDTFAVNIVVFQNTIIPKLIVNGNASFGCAPSNIKFVNNSTGANKFTINFGDGSLPYISTKNLDTIYHYYATGGNYTVTMKAENGCTDSTVVQIIQLYNKPVSSFTTTSSQYCKNEKINFTNTSSPTLSFEWRFADGFTSTAYSPTHTYTIAGTYTVELIAKNVNSSGIICTDTSRKTIIIHDIPNSSFTDNAAIQNCQPFNFIGNTIQPIGNVSNWNFSDPFSVDTTQIGNTGTHTFLNPGLYNIRLVVYNPIGCSDTSRTTVKVIETPKAIFTMSDSISCVPGKQVTFTNLYTYSLTDAVASQWYINNVLVANTKNLTYNFNVSVNITTAQVFTIKLIVTNSFGCKDSMIKTFTVLPKAKPSFTLSSTSICTPVTLQITNTSQFSNIFKWYLDGTLFSTDSVPPQITLSLPTTNYTIKLVADHTLGCGADSTVQLFVTTSKPKADFVIPIKSSCTGILNIQCNNASTVVGASILKWFWNFGDGSTSTLTNPTHTYTLPGRYTVSLYVQDDRGCLSTITTQDVINFGKPRANFNISNACIYNPAIPVNLTTPGFGSTNITSYLWNFGDGNFLVGPQPIHIYVSEGNYTISLITTSDSSCVADTFSQQITVFGKPLANFKYENNCVSLNTIFTNTSLPGYGQNNIANSKWTFGNGAIGNNFNATNIYNATGNYTVRLIVSGNRCPNLIDSIKIVVPILKGRDPLTYPRVDGVRGIPFQLNAQPNGVAYRWSPNLGLNSGIIQNPIATYAISAPNIINYNIDITDSIGCTVTDKQTVWLFTGSDVYLPTAFSPNGDGANDLFKPLYVHLSRLLSFRIFDRWGNLVFETSDMGKSWDGKLNGKPLPVDTYTWIVSAYGEGGKEVIRKGNVTIVNN